ncbi:N-ethylmaleimide reductase [Psilocybe cubensis]|uniref:N-ethylmaleimide reductase n=1 Tax=Psilocybe cubensis TaxID=181762 RepID=A0ACB8GSA3_PSICU|nr:N-ethylmaleimide reductase [Psilocybe cubensis]KAH9478464.1 N-ethylmaleimide reductase [Psilocybe cubensis]
MVAEKVLFTPLQIGSITLKNRIGMSAMTRNRALQTYPNDLLKEYYVQRTKGGAGLIVSEGILITRQGTEWPNAPGIWDEKHISEWKKITDAVHEAGGKMYAQLWHVGRVAHPDAPEQKLAGTPIYAPSAIAARGGKYRFLPGEPGNVTPTEIDDPKQFIELYKQAAINAKAAGFDGVEIQGGNGYLIHQFLDSTSNKRSDEWGGNIENRAKFGLEVLKVVVEVFGPDVALKVSPNGGYNDVGMPLQETLDTFSYFITESDKLGLAYITLVQYHPYFDPVFDVQRATKHDVIAAYAHLPKHSKVFVNSLVTAEVGEELVASGKVSGIFIGTQWINHPDLAKRIEHGKPLDNQLNFMGLNSSGEEGYTDYPTAVY